MPKNKYKQRPDGRYMTFVQDGYKADGKPNRIPVYSSKSSKDLEEKVNELKYQIKHKLYKQKSDITVEEYSEQWFLTYKAVKELNTKAMYNNIIYKHIIPEIGFKKLIDVSKTDIQQIINDRMEHRRTCEQIVLTLKQIFDSAIDDNILAMNVCKKIELPPKVPSTKRALTDIEKKAISHADFTDREKAYVLILYSCGLRREEALALTKKDIDFKNDYVHINKAIIFDGNNAVLKDAAKSVHGIRKVDLPAAVKPFLKQYTTSLSSLYLFTKLDGSMITKSSYIKMWDSIVNKMNIAAGGDHLHRPIIGLTAHIFRHNYCTMLYYSDISLKKAVELMGHSDEKMIMKVYAHLDESKENTKDKINKMIAI